MNVVKIIPKSQRAQNRVGEHGEEMELLDSKSDSFMVRSLKETWKYREGVMGKWVGTFRNEEAEYEDVK